ncbi:AraC family transcriptional regulator [Ktedonosporobacter rubrisoli]|uniref:AraC family transcriptional regulator n=1 Tax=Ktedonosporobacter rubrisoli TaxID=2509675 RepID=A0A4P6K368_KTERU|nr:AraC family transcriptional regulator [Ktedonosporobacter rubrisoli]QBD82485.1 AraC family transcriptional regulator [Ktedonosporobacter rubrisoli]
MDTRERTKFWQDPMLSNLELLHATYVTHTFAPHTHEAYVIGVVERGAEQFGYRHRHHIAPVGSIVLINPGEMHTGSSATKDGWTYRALYPSPELLQRAASEIVGKPRDFPFFGEAVIDDPELMAEIALTHRILEEQASSLERESRLLWMLARLIVRHADDHPQPGPLPKEHQGLKRARAFLDEHYTENISLEQLAMVAQLSPFHLLRLFREQVHLPPHAYQLQLRIQRAKELLRSGMSGVDTALAVGFADQSHLTKHFKRIVGVPPGQYYKLQQK